MARKAMMMWAASAALRGRGSFTLLEVLIALAIAGLLAAAALPFLLDAWPGASDPSEDLRAAARRTRFEALQSGETKRIVITSRGFLGQEGSPIDELPEGWWLEIRRPGEHRFRKPRPAEIWQFNSEGLCEPIELRLQGPDEFFVAAFDPLTALEPPRSGL